MFAGLELPAWLYGILVPGIYKTPKVVSVICPHYVFPLFTTQEDLGSLPCSFNGHFFKGLRHGNSSLCAWVLAAMLQVSLPHQILQGKLCHLPITLFPATCFPLLIVLASILLPAIQGLSSLWAAPSILAAVVLGIAQR